MYYFIINPVAGGGKINRWEPKMRAYLASRNIPVEIVKTISSGDAVHLARVGLKKGYRRIICVGGDGTVHEVVNGMKNGEAEIGIIPTGYNNFFATKLNIPASFWDALELSLGENFVEVDVGIVEDEYFLLSAGIGIEALFAQFNRAYGVTKNTIDIVPLRLEVVVDDSYLIDATVVTASVVNSGYLFQKSFPQFTFNVNDKCLNLVLISYVANLGYINELFKGKRLGPIRELTMVTARKFEFRTTEILPLQADGELIRKTTPVIFEIAPFKQKIVVKTGLVVG